MTGRMRGQKAAGTWLATDLTAATYPVDVTLRGTGEEIVELVDLPFRIRTVA